MDGVCGCVCVCTHHADIEGVEQVKGQGGDQIHKQPGCDVVNADGAGVVHDLAGRAHVGGPEVQHDIWHTAYNLTHQWELGNTIISGCC